MGFELLEIGIKMKKVVIFTTRVCSRSVSNHPFLVGNLCFLIFLYRSFPLFFSLLVSVFPVLVCAAILLGTILCFGQPNIPEIEIKEKPTFGSLSIETGVSGDSIVVEQNENHYYVDRYDDVKRDGAEQLSNKPSLSESRNGEICRESVISIVEEETLRKIKSGDGEVWEDTIDEPGKYNEWNEGRVLSDGEIGESRYSSILKKEDRNNGLDDVNSFNSEMVNVDSLNSPHSPWKHIENEDDEGNEEGIVSDTGSDGTQSSSSDASTTDIMPLLDELHPLLDEDSSNAIHVLCNSSSIVSEQSSSRPSTSSSESVDEIGNCEDFEVEEDDNEDDEDEDGQGEKGEGSKSAITWTEEDQKNLMDLGSSEIERNQRLENLILRRRKNVSMVPEINLIDLEDVDFPPHVGAISTSRQIPFDDPFDSNIPGSAPSVLLQRRNPFEIPYESSQGNGNPMGDDGFREQLPFFKRHESFSVGLSVFAPNRQDVKMRPYFVPERMNFEESNFFPFHCQSSQLSESKASSILEMESPGLVEDLEDRKLLEDDCSSQELLEDVVEGPPEEEDYTTFKKESFNEDVISEPQLISEMNHVSEHIGHGSQSSSDEDEEESLGFKKSYSRGSSSSLMSEVSERTFIEIDEKKDGAAEEPDNSTQTSSVESGGMNVMSSKEPIYDSSPTSVTKNLPSSSVSCDVHEPSQSLPPVLVKRTVSFAERDSENMEIDKKITSDTASSVEIFVDESLIIDKEETVASPNSDERLMSTPSGGGGSTYFHDIAMHEPNFEHLEEVPVPNTPVESNEKMQTIQNLNMPEIYELDHDTSSSSVSPLSPDFISMSSTASSHVDMEIIREEVDEIKEIDEGLSSNLDSIGDFSIMNEFKKHMIDSVGETSNMNETGYEIDKYEEDTECKSGIDAMGSRVFTFKGTYNEGTSFSEENEDKPPDSALNHNYQDNYSLPEVVDGQVYMETGLPEIEARKVEDIDEVYKELGDKEIEPTSHVEGETISEENEANLVIYALTRDQVIISEKTQSDMQIEKVCCSPKKDESTSIAQGYTDTAFGMPESTRAVCSTHETLFLGSRSIEEDTLDHYQVNDVSLETRKNPDSIDLHPMDIRETAYEDRFNSFC